MLNYSNRLRYGSASTGSKLPVFIHISNVSHAHKNCITRLSFFITSQTVCSQFYPHQTHQFSVKITHKHKIPDVCHNLHIYIRNRTVIQCYLQQLSVDIKQRQAYATNTVSFTHFFIGPCNDLSLNNRVSSILAGQLGQYAQCVRFHQLPNQCYENKHKNLVCYTQSAKNTSIYLL